MSPEVVGYISLVALFVFLFARMPIGFAMLLAAIPGMVYLRGWDAAFGVIGSVPFRTSASFIMTCIPLFVLMGEFANYSGIARDFFNAMHKWLGHVKGGLAIATIAGCAGFAAVSGSSLATAATMGMVSLPEMKRYNYKDTLATGCVAAGGTIGILIPPSLGLIIYSAMTNESVGKLYMGGFLPGIMLTVIFIIIITILCRLNPSLAPSVPRASFREMLKSLPGIWGILVVFVLVIGGIYAGIFTATEAAAIGAFVCFIFVIGKRQFSWKVLTKSLFDTGRTTAMLFMIIMGATVFAYFLALTNLPSMLSEFVISLPISRYLILGAIVLMYVILGCFMEGMGVLVLTIPIIYPMILALGFDPIWFGILVIVMSETGFITPPVGVNVFVIAGIAPDVPMYTIFKGIIPFLIGMFVCIGLLIAFPQIALVLPNLMK